MIVDVLLYLIAFSFFVVLQALCINGVHESFTGEYLAPDLNGERHYQGMIFYMIAPKFIENNKRRYIFKPIFGCIKCMASFWGAVTFWPLVIYLFSFKCIEVFIFCGDVFILVYLNFYFFKKV